MKTILTTILTIAISIGSTGVCFADRKTESKDEVRAERFIKAQLKDPDSAKFQFHETIVETAKGDILLVKVNSKNSFGGFTGWEMWGVIFYGGTKGEAIPPHIMRAMGVGN